MKVYPSNESLDLPGPIALTIGSFDGVHLGHQKLIQEMAQRAGTIGLLTYPTHPSTLLSDNPVCPIQTLDQRLDELARVGLDFALLQPFDREFACLSYDAFLRELHQQLAFDHLVLGYDSCIGKGREGRPEKLAPLAHELGFTLTYVSPLLINAEPVSSSRVRQAIQEGKLQEVERLLGRPLSYRQKVLVGPGHGRRLGYPTANLDISALCMPPFGVYAVRVQGDEAYAGVANLGVAPTIQTDRPPLLEVYLFDVNADLYGQEVEVVLESYLRPEQKFASLAALKEQIAKDVLQAKRHLGES